MAQPDATQLSSSVYQSREQRVITGPGSARHALAEELSALGANRVLLIAGDAELLMAQDVCQGIDLVGTFSAIRPHVPIETADAARAMARTTGADVLLTVGGGSTTGTGKAVALTERLPLVAVPTTYAGSEATDVWGVTEGNRKSTGTDRAVLPKVVFYDPVLTLSLPPALTVSSGLNALAHCVDSLWAPATNPPSTAAAVEGIRLLGSALPAVLARPDDLTARQQCLWGTYLAAVAFSGAGSGLHHKICHVLGGAYGLEHASMHAVVLPHVLGFNGPAAPEAMARIASALAEGGVGDGRDALAALLDLYRVLGAPRSLAELGLLAEQVTEAAGLAFERVPSGNPRPVSITDLIALLTRAHVGEPAVTVPVA